MCANTANQTFFCVRGSNPHGCRKTEFSMVFLSGAAGAPFPLCAGRGVGHFLVACVRRSRAMKTITMKHVGANSYPEGSGSYPEGSGLFNRFILFGARFPLCVGVGGGIVFAWEAQHFVHMRFTISRWAQHFVTWYSGCFDESQCQG